MRPMGGRESRGRNQASVSWLPARGWNPSPSQGDGEPPASSKTDVDPWPAQSFWLDPEKFGARVTSPSRKTNSVSKCMRGEKTLDPFPQPWFKTSIRCMYVRERMSSPRKAPAPMSPCRASRLKADFAAHPHGVGARDRQGSGGVRVGGVRLGRFGL